MTVLRILENCSMMAGKGGLDDLGDLEIALEHAEGEQGAQPEVVHAEGEQGVQEIPPFTVLSWNIFGKTRAGTAESRNHVVPRLVSQLNPDVLLLQEIPTEKIIRRVIDQCQQDHNRLYYCVNAGVKTEARILYDRNMFELDRRVGLDGIVKELFDPQLTPLALQGEKEVFRDRVVAVRLTHIGTQNDIIFVSFHNSRRNAADRATRFCKVVATLANKENAPVVAGADLNCTRYVDNFHPGDVHVPTYGPTSRRPVLNQIDFFIYDSPDNITVADEVTAWDFLPDALPAAADHPFNQIFVGLQQDLGTCKDSLNHDPLSCSLNITHDNQ